jgi:hypothetical protein
LCFIVSAKARWRILANRHADPGDARRVGHREVVAGTDRHLVVDLDLAAQVHEEGAVGGVDDARARQVLEAVDDLLTVGTVARADRDVAHDTLARGLHQVDRADVAAGIADGHGDAAQHARPVGDRQTDGDAVGRARRDGH